MRLRHMIGSFLLFSIIIMAGEVSSEKLEYEELKVDLGEVVSVSNSQIWLEGDILVDGSLSIENTHINVNRSLDMTISELRVNSTGSLNISNCTISTSNNDNFSYSMFTIVSDSGFLNITNTDIDYSMIWLVGGEANIVNSSMDGHNIVNYGIFSEDTSLNMDNVSVTNYSLGLRSIGAVPVQNQVIFSNCTNWMTQEWWVNFTAIDTSTNSTVAGFQVRQWDVDNTMLGTWNWAKEYEIDSAGQRIDYVATFSAFAIFGLAHVDDTWSQSITDNTELVRYFNLNISQIKYKSAEVYVSGEAWIPGEAASKWSEINVYVTIENPTDYNFSYLFLDMYINNNTGFARDSISLPPKSEIIGNISWQASFEGAMPLRITTDLGLSSSSDEDSSSISLMRFVQVGGQTEEEKDSGALVGLFSIFLILAICSYVIYSGMEEVEEELDNDSTITEGNADVRESFEEPDKSIAAIPENSEDSESGDLESDEEE